MELLSIFVEAVGDFLQDGFFGAVEFGEAFIHAGLPEGVFCFGERGEGWVVERIGRGGVGAGFAEAFDGFDGEGASFDDAHGALEAPGEEFFVEPAAEFFGAEFLLADDLVDGFVAGFESFEEADLVWVELFAELVVEMGVRCLFFSWHRFPPV